MCQRQEAMEEISPRSPIVGNLRVKTDGQRKKRRVVVVVAAGNYLPPIGGCLSPKFSGHPKIDSPIRGGVQVFNPLKHRICGACKCRCNHASMSAE